MTLQSPAISSKEALERWHQLPLTEAEFHVIETNAAPYLQR